MNTVEHAAKRPRLSEKTRLFVRHVFESGAVELLDERRRQVLEDYVLDDRISFDALRVRIGVSRAQTRRLYIQALTTVWQASSPEIQQRFPKEEVVKGKNTGTERTLEEREVLRAANIGRKLSPEHKEKIRKANTKRKPSEEAKNRMRASALERWRREKAGQQKGEKTIFINQNIK